MTDFIIQYWLEFLFGGIIAVLGFFVKHYYQLWKKEKETQKNEFWAQAKQELEEYNRKLLDQKEKILASEDAKLQKAIGQIGDLHENLLHAVLEVQGKQFKTDCKTLLETPNSITFEQFETLTMEHDVYTSLGGNGFGTALFELVKEKYSSQMMQKDLTDNLAGQLNNNNQNNNNKPRG